MNTHNVVTCFATCQPSDRRRISKDARRLAELIYQHALTYCSLYTSKRRSEEYTLPNTEAMNRKQTTVDHVRAIVVIDTIY